MRRLEALTSGGAPRVGAAVLSVAVHRVVILGSDPAFGDGPDKVCDYHGDEYLARGLRYLFSELGCRQCNEINIPEAPQEKNARAQDTKPDDLDKPVTRGLALRRRSVLIRVGSAPYAHKGSNRAQEKWYHKHQQQGLEYR